tara:strand:+ start:7030 stop:9345 length:2316 start_codon:yes stop_codon:yes gene_type:complete
MDEAMTLLKSLKIVEETEGPSAGKHYVDSTEYNAGVEALITKINKNINNLSIKTGFEFKAIRRAKLEGQPNSKYLRTEEQVADFNSQNLLNFPARSGTTANMTLMQSINNLKNEPGFDPKDIPKGWVTHARYTEYTRLMDDKDMRSSIGKNIAQHFAFPSQVAGIEDDFIGTKVTTDNFDIVDRNTAEGSLLEVFTYLSHQVFALKAVGGFKGKNHDRRFIISSKNDTIISVPVKPPSTLKDKPKPTELVPVSYLEAIGEAVDRSVRPDKSKYIRVINLFSAADHPLSSTLSSGELAHYNSASMQVNVLVDRAVNAVEEFNSTPAGPKKDELAKEYSDPRARESVETLLKYTVAHELGHMMANHIWDHPELNAQHYPTESSAKATPLWRFRDGLPRMQKDLAELMAKEKISTYAESSTDEWFAEAYAKYIFSGEPHSEEFKKLLDDYGLIRGKARKWVYDPSSTSPAGRENIDSAAAKSYSFTNAAGTKAKKDEISEKFRERAETEIFGFSGKSLEQKIEIYNSFAQAVMGNNISNITVKNLENKSDTPEDELMRGLLGLFRSGLNSWNGSSNTSTSLKMMVLVREIFGIDENDSLSEIGRADLNAKDGQSRAKYLEVAKKTLKDNPEGAKLWSKLLKLQYNIAQEEFRKETVTEFILFRGWPGMNRNKGSVKVKTRPLSSFTSNAQTAKSFTQGPGDITVGVIPVERIFSFFGLGFGVAGESEFIVLGGDYDMLNMTTEELFSVGASNSNDMLEYVKNKVGQGIEVESDN